MRDPTNRAATTEKREGPSWWSAFVRGGEITGGKAREILRYLGPGILVTVGFIDPGNWASNVAAGSVYGFSLLWMVTLSTIMLILLQHNAAHLGIATGLCLSEAASIHLPPWASRTVLGSAVLASISTALAEILGGAIALNILFGLPVRIGSMLVTAAVAGALASNGYRRLEKVIIGFVSLIGLAFLFELSLVKIDWGAAAVGWVIPNIPAGSMPVVMSVLGAVVMPHNLFLHSEVIQSRRWDLEDEPTIRRQLKFEFLDTLFSMIAGWAINSAMILVAASAFFARGVKVEALEQASAMLGPLLGNGAATVFALALLFAGIASSITAGMAGGSIFAGIFREPYDIGDKHSRAGVVLTLGGALLAIFFVGDPFRGLIYSQMLLSMQLPLTILLQIRLTASKRVMGRFANSPTDNLLLGIVAAVVIVLNIMLLKALLAG
jgi:manganese transport protein